MRILERRWERLRCLLETLSDGFDTVAVTAIGQDTVAITAVSADCGGDSTRGVGRCDAVSFDEMGSSGRHDVSTGANAGVCARESVSPTSTV